MPQYSSMNGIELNASTATRSPGRVPSSRSTVWSRSRRAEEVVVGEPDVAADHRLAIARDTYRSTQRMDERVHGTSIAHTASGRESAELCGRLGGRHAQAMNASTFSA